MNDEKPKKKKSLIHLVDDEPKKDKKLPSLGRVKALLSAPEDDLLPAPPCPTPGCKESAGARTTHAGYGPCLAHEKNYQPFGIVQGYGAFTETLKKMDQLTSPVDDLDVLIRIKYANMQCLTQKADVMAVTGADVPVELLKEIRTTSNEIARDIRDKKKLELQSLNKVNVTQKFVLQFLNGLTSILKAKIRDPSILREINEELKNYAQTILTRQEKV